MNEQGSAPVGKDPRDAVYVNESYVLKEFCDHPSSGVGDIRPEELGLNFEAYRQGSNVFVAPAGEISGTMKRTILNSPNLRRYLSRRNLISNPLFQSGEFTFFWMASRSEAVRKPQSVDEYGDVAEGLAHLVERTPTTDNETAFLHQVRYALDHPDQ